MTTLCTHHEDALLLAVELRGLLRQTPEASTFDPMAFARRALVEHCTNFAGQAALAMLAQRWCPLCFVNEHNPSNVNLDNWVTCAADEALAEHAARAQQRTTEMKVVLVS